jgi:threonine dehydratase
MSLKSLPTGQDIQTAHERIRAFIKHTPVLTCSDLDEIAGFSLFFKCENLQEIGAFKARGAMNAALSLSDDERRNGIATHSSGNHAQAIARAAGMLNIKSYVVMPRTVLDVKKNGVKKWGGEIFECEPNLASREQTLAEVIRKTSAIEIHPFNNYDVIAGQATAAKELLEEIHHLDIVIAPVGGGGLLSGTCLSAKYFSPSTQVIAAEPEGADDAFRSMQTGKIEVSQANTIADGLLTSLGDKTFPIIREHVKEVVTVTDHEIIQATKLIWEKLKMIVEPSGAVALASALKAKHKLQGKRVGVIFSGGNVDLKKILELISK